MQLKEVAKHLEVHAFYGDERAEVQGVAADSRKVGRDFIFAAIRGTHFDGHDFLPSAREGGATTVLSEQPPSFYHSLQWNWIQVRAVRPAMALASLAVYRHPDRQIPLIGVTGTSGKTTTTYLLEAIFRAAGERPAVLGTISARFGGAEIPAEHTTPESPDVIAFARQVADAGGRPLIMEVSSHALSLQRVYGLAFDTAVFTNLGRDHLDFYPGLDAYLDAKRRLFDGRNGPPPRRAVFNLDDPCGRELFEAFPGEKYGTGRAPDAAARIAAHRFTPDGLEFAVEWQGRRFDLATPLSGEGNLHNAVQAFACAAALGVSPEAIQRALASMPAVPGRLEEVLPGHPFRVFVDFAHKEDALANALRLLRGLTPGRLIVVFGCGGDRDRGKRPHMGAVAARLSDIVVLTSDNPRREDPEAILDEIVPGVREVRDDFVRLADRREAIAEAFRLARPGDTVLLAGKGHEREQILADRTIPFDDRLVALELLGAGGGERP
jgi:UDP-N-acetylmuramoyl-L-alanyl-D-glutamate--2,6-diaminopimelate ligase